METLKALVRIIVLPFIAIATLPFYLGIWLHWCYCFVVHGGEMISYFNSIYDTL